MDDLIGVPNVKTVEYNFISENCGLEVSNICLGGMTFGDEEGKNIFATKGLSEMDSHKIMDKFSELGGNFIDTANCYSDGDSERYIGSWMRKQTRDDYVIATKTRWPYSFNAIGKNTPNGSGLTRRYIIQSLEGSLERLQTNYIDLFQIHAPDYPTPIEETLRTLDDMVRCGKVRYLGASNLKGYQMQKIIDLCNRYNYNPFVTLQQQYNLLARCSEADVFKACLDEGLGILPWSPLSGGLLSGKYKDTKDLPEDSRVTNMMKGPLGAVFGSELESDRFGHLMTSMNQMAIAHEVSIAQVALKWLLQRPGVNSVIIGARKMSQLEDNMKAGGPWKLTNEEMAELTKWSDVPLPYPYDPTIDGPIMIRSRKNQP